VAMAFKVCGFRPHTIWHSMVKRAAWQVVSRKVRNAA
jgi:hypothetical protein